MDNYNSPEWMDDDNEPLSHQYEYLKVWRKSFERIAYRCAGVTVLWCFPARAYTNMRIGWNHLDAQDLRSPYCGENPLLVTTLASRVVQALFPQNIQFFFLELDETADFQDAQGNRIRLNGSQKQRLREQLLTATKKLITRMQERQLFAAMEVFETYAIVTGSALISIKRKRKPRVFRLDTYVLDRDSYGNILKYIIYERVDRKSLSPAMRQIVDKKTSIPVTKLGEAPNRRHEHEVHTTIEREDASNDNMDEASYREYSEVDDVYVQDTLSTYPAGRPLPYIYLPWKRAYDEIYGRGRVEELYGLHNAAEGLTEMTLQSAAASARRVKMLKRGGLTDLDEYCDAPNLGVIYGDWQEVGEGQSLPNNDMQLVINTRQGILETLRRAYGSVDMPAVERRTAEEASIIDKELNASQGGIWSTQLDAVVVPTIRNYLQEMIDEDEIEFDLKGPGVQKAIVPRVVTGIDALPRNEESNRRAMFFQMNKSYLDSGMAPYTNKRIVIGRNGTALGLDVTDELLKDEEIAEMEKQQKQMEMMKGVPPALVGALAKGGQGAPQGAPGAPMPQQPQQ